MKRLFTFCLSIAIALSAFASTRTPEQAAQIAAQFVNQRPSIRLSSQATASAMQLAYTGNTADQSTPAYYVFNQPGQQGAVFVSADDSSRPVLGYTDKGDFDYTTANPTLRWWLARYARQMDAISQNSIQAPARNQDYAPIDPLLGDIEYDQEKPYSNLCPLEGTHRSLTGCVATATAQVMRMWGYPAQGSGSHSYTSAQLRKTVSAEFNVPYDWNNMLHSYSGSYNSTQANAIATLMFHCGVACDMDYAYEAGSGAYTDDMANGLVKYFGYKVSKFITQFSLRDYGTASFQPAEYAVRTSSFLKYIYSDIEAGRPVIMGGNDTYGEGGHEFVCDGRDKDGNLHINWGWSGDGNGYFAITALDYDGYEFSSDLDAIIGLEPGNTEPVPVESISLNPASLTLSINERHTITATILPSNSTVRFATWTSSDPSVASVSNGTIKGLSQGTTTITATAEGKQATAVVTVTSDVADSQDFVLVTDENELSVGDQILIVNEDNQVALAKTQNKNNRAEASVNITGNAIAIVDENSTDVQIITLTQGSTNDSYGLMTEEGYLYAASSSKNYLRSQSKLTDNASWLITFDDGQALIVSQGSYTHNTIFYNSHNQIFSAYLNPQSPIAVYARHTATANEQVQADDKGIRKILRNGQLIIIRGNEEYNAHGILLQK